MSMARSSWLLALPFLAACASSAPRAPAAPQAVAATVDPLFQGCKASPVEDAVGWTYYCDAFFASVVDASDETLAGLLDEVEQSLGEMVKERKDGKIEKANSEYALAGKTVKGRQITFSAGTSGIRTDAAVLAIDPSGNRLVTCTATLDAPAQQCLHVLEKLAATPWRDALIAGVPRKAKEEPADDAACGTADECFDQGVTALNGGDRDRAEALLSEACKKDHARACANYSALVQEQSSEESDKAALKACTLGNALGCTNLASSLYMRGDKEGAMRAAKQGCDGRSPGGCAYLAHYLVDANKPAEAAKAAQQGLDLSKDDGECHAALGLALLAQGKVDAGVAQIKAAEKLLEDQRAPFQNTVEPVPELLHQSVVELKMTYPAMAVKIDQALKRLPELEKH